VPDGGPSLAAGEAQRIFSGLLQHDPNNVAALRLLGLCRVRSGDAAGGLEVLARARALAPDEAETLLHYGIALLACGRANEAAALFRANRIAAAGRSRARRGWRSRRDDPAPPATPAASPAARRRCRIAGSGRRRGSPTPRRRAARISLRV
jgi:hypothetical protein